MYFASNIRAVATIEDAEVTSSVILLWFFYILIYVFGNTLKYLSYH